MDYANEHVIKDQSWIQDKVKLTKKMNESLEILAESLDHVNHMNDIACEKAYMHEHV